MRSRSGLTLVVVACSMLASCASSPQPVSAPPKPLPLEYAVRCAAPPDLPVTNAGTLPADAAVRALKAMYDLYATCAGRFVDLVGWIQNHEREQTKR